MPDRSQPATIYVVGDVHRNWRPVDGHYLEQAAPDLVLFVGDLGDEDVEFVGEIADLRANKAVMLGNHDAWRSFSEKRVTPALAESLERLGNDHLAYSRRELASAGLSLVGARPFSWGGEDIRSPEVYGDLYGVTSHIESSRKIVAAAREAEHDDLMILAHNGPRGLSRKSQDIFGKDFGRSPRGDWGDRDLMLALRTLRETTDLRVRCVVAGHMHHKVRTPKGAERVRFVRESGTLFVNSAVVPRVRKFDGVQLGHFVRMTWAHGELLELEEVWVDASGTIRRREQPEIIDVEATE